MSRPSIFITGAAAGIGQATARPFAAKGWYVGLFDVDETGVQRLRQELGANNCYAAKLDVCNHEAWQQTLADFVNRLAA